MLILREGRLGWKPTELRSDPRPRSDPDKLAIAVRLRRETTLTVARIAERLRRGSWKSLRNKLYLRSKAQAKEESDKSTV